MKKTKVPIKGLYCRNGIFYYRKVVPLRLRKPGFPSEIILSLNTRDESIALSQYTRAKAAAEDDLKAMKDEDYVPSDTNTFSQSQKRAKAQGRELRDIEELVNNRIAVREAARALKSKKYVNKGIVKSLLCRNDDETRILDLPRIYAHAHRHELKSDNTREYSRVIDPLNNACKKITEYLGENKKVKDLNKKDAKSFHEHLKDKILNGQTTPNTASKYMKHLRVLLNEYYLEKDLDVKCVFSKLSFKKEDKKRLAMNIDYIDSEWIGKKALDKMNGDIRNILYAMIDTGCNFKELCGLDPNTDIRLNHETPHIILRDNKYRKLKTPYRERRIPLVGLALEAFKNCPMGFARYRTANGPTNASAAINKFLKENNLFEYDGQTAYSIRHCFKDRMREHSVPGEIQDYIMGHKSPGMGTNYGNGYTLKKLRETLEPLTEDIRT
jgi:hypothetical protein